MNQALLALVGIGVLVTLFQLWCLATLNAKLDRLLEEVGEDGEE